MGAVRWTVEVANRKAVAFKLTGPAQRRNGASGNDLADAALIIKAVPRIVDETTPDVVLEGQFKGAPVVLGRAVHQKDGSLVFTGGKGISGSRPPSSGGPSHFADNDGWFDDTCDGPIRAEVTLRDGTTRTALAARVIVGPPDFAPDVQPWVTLHDIAYQAAIDRGFITAEPRPSFARFIRPFLIRSRGFAWVNQIGGSGHSAAAPGGFATARLEALGDPSEPPPDRRRILGRFRNPALHTDSTPGMMPRLLSEDGYLEDKRRVLALPPIFFSYFQLWSDGTFKGDAQSDPFANESVVDALDRMAMEACAGGGFFPGIEVPRIVSDKNLWIAAFRLDPELPAGKLTEGLAVPWQADFSACQWEADSEHAWWPTQRPDHVFRSAADVETGKRSDWDRGAKSAKDLIDNQTYSRLGIIRKKGAVLIETERDLPA
jgi:hypothetical protein